MTALQVGATGEVQGRLPHGWRITVRREEVALGNQKWQLINPSYSTTGLFWKMIPFFLNQTLFVAIV